MKEFHSLITNTTSLVGYIAVLMFVGAYLGGDKSFTLNPTLLKGSLSEYSSLQAWTELPSSSRTVIITVDGRQYEAQISEKTTKKPEFPY